MPKRDALARSRCFYGHLALSASSFASRWSRKKPECSTVTCLKKRPVIRWSRQPLYNGTEVLSMSQNQSNTRAYSAAHFGLTLDDEGSSASKDVGLFRSIEGGGVRADVASYQMGGQFNRWRQLGKPKFEDIKLQVGMAMSKPFYEWISAFFDKKPTRKNGSIIAADFYYGERAVREFTGALIKELTFPALSGTDKNAVYMGVAMAVEDIKFKKGSGSKMEPPKGFDSQKLWTAANFTFLIDGFKDACKRVTKVDSFTLKQNIAEYHGGGFRGPVKAPTVIEFPNISFHIPEADAQPFFDQAKAGVVGGAAGGAQGHAHHVRQRRQGAVHRPDGELRRAQRDARQIGRLDRGDQAGEGGAVHGADALFLRWLGASPSTAKTARYPRRSPSARLGSGAASGSALPPLKSALPSLPPVRRRLNSAAG
ncbi:MAG: phage tail protein [Myxococcales bacterium]|nr:phage tail protein [Myxococcales bacterium]